MAHDVVFLIGCVFHRKDSEKRENDVQASAQKNTYASTDAGTLKNFVYLCETIDAIKTKITKTIYI